MNRIVILIVGAFPLAVSVATAAPRALPCVNYGDCARAELPAYRLFEMDFGDPRRIEAWLERTGSNPAAERGALALAACPALREDSRELSALAPSVTEAADSVAAEGGDCLSPIAQSWEQAERWCQSNGWRLHRIDGRTKVTCIIGAGA